jgi:hypothetical protein
MQPSAAAHLEIITGDIDSLLAAAAAPYPQKQLIDLASRWYEQGVSSYDFMNYVDAQSGEQEERCIQIKFLFHTLKTEYGCEKLFLWTLLDFFLHGSMQDLKRMLI